MTLYAAITKVRKLKEQHIEACEFETSAALRDIERVLVAEQQAQMPELRSETVPFLSRLAQVAQAVAEAPIETITLVQPCRYCGRELGSRISGPQDHDHCPEGRCLDLPALPGADRLRGPAKQRTCPACKRVMPFAGRQHSIDSYLDDSLPNGVTIIEQTPDPQGRCFKCRVNNKPVPSLFAKARSEGRRTFSARGLDANGVAYDHLQFQGVFGENETLVACPQHNTYTVHAVKFPTIKEPLALDIPKTVGVGDRLIFPNLIEGRADLNKLLGLVQRGRRTRHTT